MPTHVLVIDSNEAFATLLKEGLEADREYRVMLATDGPSALAALQSNAFDLAILDLGLEAPEPMTMLRAIRGVHADLPLMVIPLDGDAVPQELEPFEIRGVLTKPFFLPDLPARIADALGRPRPSSAPMPSPAPQAAPSARSLPRLTLPRNDPRVSDALRALVDVLAAEAVLLTDGRSIVAQAGLLSSADAATLAESIFAARDEAARTAWRALGHEQVRFGQLPGGGERLLYSIAIAEGLLLSIAVQPDAALRVIRAQARQTAETLMVLGK